MTDYDYSTPHHNNNRIDSLHLDAKALISSAKRLTTLLELEHQEMSHYVTGDEHTGLFEIYRLAALSEAHISLTLIRMVIADIIGAGLTGFTKMSDELFDKSAEWMKIAATDIYHGKQNIAKSGIATKILADIKAKMNERSAD